MLLLAAPGQGAQAPGFLGPWLDLPGFADRLEAWSELAGCDLIRCGTTASAEQIRDTAIAQPLLVATAIAATEQLAGGPVMLTPGATPQPPLGIGTQSVAVAGHSVGELGAGTIAGVITPRDAMKLVRVRARAMAAAAAVEETGMTAVLGGDEQVVLAALDAHGLTPANVNAAGQIVAAGTLGQLAALAADPPPGTRLRPLAVAGAFHTAHMAPAIEVLRTAAREVTTADPIRPLLSNLDGAVVRSGKDWLERMVHQISAPVRWDKCMQTMAGLGITALVELPPAGTLSGIARRALPGIQIVALKTPADLEAARVVLAEHADSHSDSHAPEWRLLVAPVAGTFRAPSGHPDVAAAGAAISAGTQLGHVEIRGGQNPVSAGFPATVIEWLVEDGDPVSPGQPLVRLLPERAD
jgi:[acyl-carrier-protein] S-malonyltransferase